MQGTISRIQIKDGKFGKYSDLEINGEQITAYKGHHEAATQMAEGDTVEYAYELKNGKYKNFTMLKKLGSGAVSVAVTQAAKRFEVSRDESMFISYAKDLMVAGKAETPEIAMATIFELLKAAKDGMKENPTS